MNTWNMQQDICIFIYDRTYECASCLQALNIGLHKIALTGEGRWESQSPSLISPIKDGSTVKVGLSLSQLFYIDCANWGQTKC